METKNHNIIIFSTKRSSHHAFIEGLLANKNYLYENNLRITQDGVLPRAVEEQPNAQLKTGSVVKLASLEMNYDLSKLATNKRFRKYEEDFRRGGPLTKAIFIRDPINTIASTYSAHLKDKTGRRDMVWVDKNIRHWLKLAKHSLNGDSSELFIYANRFWSDPEYQSSALHELDIDSAVYSTKLSRFGRGGNSFFDSKEAGITANALATRYEYFVDDGQFSKLIAEPETRAVCSDFLEFVDDARLLQVLWSF